METVASVTAPIRARRPEIVSGEAAVFLRELVAAATAGARVLDAGCGPGSWPYDLRTDITITGFDIKFPPGPPEPAKNVQVFRGDLARLPLRSQTFDLTLCHYVLEHVTELDACCDELARVTRLEGILYVAVPRSASFDDRLYRFAGYFAKFALFKWRKRLEHQQRFGLQKVLDLFYGRGFILSAYALVPAGFSWMNDPRIKRLQAPFTAALAWLHRLTGLDLARDANLVLAFRKAGQPARAPDLGRGEISASRRRVTHVCRRCGEHSIIDPQLPWPGQWVCPWCGEANPLGRPR